MDHSNKWQQGPQSVSADTREVVFYDAQLFELWVNGILVKRLDIRAVAQISILSAFQEDNWAPRIDDPLHPNGRCGKARLRDAIYGLNGHHHAKLIHFFADGSGEGIRWEFVSVPAKTHAHKVKSGWP